MGSKRRPFYRIIATDSRNPRDGRFIETLGYYDPMKEPADVNIKEDLVFKWMQRGAQPTESTEQILRSAGVMKKWSLLKNGVSREELDAKYEELKSTETPPMDAADRERKAAEKKAAAGAEVTGVPEETPEVTSEVTPKETPKETPENPPVEAAEAPESAAGPEAEATAEPAPEIGGGSGSEEEKTEAEAPEATDDETKKDS
jgi:small subunit ribosomal protein S16